VLQPVGRLADRSDRRARATLRATAHLTAARHTGSGPRRTESAAARAVAGTRGGPPTTPTPSAAFAYHPAAAHAWDAGHGEHRDLRSNAAHPSIICLLTRLLGRTNVMRVLPGLPVEKRGNRIVPRRRRLRSANESCDCLQS